jgi:hypothetical protein
MKIIIKTRMFFLPEITTFYLYNYYCKFKYNYIKVLP